MANKIPHSIADQIALLKQRGMLFNHEQSANHFLDLFASNPNLPIYKLGFLNNWRNQPIWK
jgi:hypothetical protein